MEKNRKRAWNGKNKRRVITWILLVLYIGFIIYTTLLCREPKDYREYNFQLFWSYQRFFDDVQPQGQQILLNILFFIPFGVLVPFCVDGSWKRKLVITIISACLLSGTVEFLQLLCKLGFAEFDDVFDNTMGAAIGAVVALMLMKLKGKGAVSLRRRLYNGISVLFTFLKFGAMKVLHGKHFQYQGIQRFSPNTEVIIADDGTLELGNRVRAHRRSKLSVFGNGTLKIGSNTALGNGVSILCMEKIVLGEGVQIGPDTKIYDHDHDFRVPGGVKAEKFVSAPVEIGDNTWIGCNVVILRGTTIGKNCIVVAGSVLKGNYPDNSIIVQKRQTSVTTYPFEERKE